MHTPNHRSRVSAASYKTAGSTPIRETLGSFLNFHHPIPQTPEEMQLNNNPLTNDADYTDNSYNQFINNVHSINQTYDAVTQNSIFDPTVSQDIDFTTLFGADQSNVSETAATVKNNSAVAPSPPMKVSKKNKTKKPSNSSSVASSASFSKQRASSSSSSQQQQQQQIMSPLKKRLSSKRSSTKGMGTAVKRIRMSDYAIDSSSSSDESDDKNSSSDDEEYVKKNDVIVLEKNNVAKNNVTHLVVNDDAERILIKPKSRGRYAKKMCVSSALKPVHVEKPTPSDPATETIFNEIITKTKNKISNDNNRLFTSHMLDTSYYMFIVSKSANADEVYTLRYINCVHSVHNEYTAHHMHHDRFVLIVTLERYRFMISYKLLLDMKIEIPIQDQFSEKQLTDNNKNLCIFEEVKDFRFMSLLINTFRLDQVYIQGKISLLLASVGEKKARVIHEQLTQMIDTKVLFTLPLSITKKEAPNQEELKKYDMSLYVDDIIKYTAGLRFKKMANDDDENKLSRAQIVNAVTQSLSFWYENKQGGKNKTKTNAAAAEKSSFTYKYGCITRQFYDPAQKGVKKLYKVKKENGSAKLIENYLNACKERFENHSFILITTKSDERITIVKKGMEFLWITSVIKDIVVTDIIKKYKMYNHYIYNLNNGSRKEINIRHNGMIKLLSNYTGDRLTLNETNSIAVNKFGCNLEKVIFDKKSAQNTE
ncbi:IE-1 [Spodoptera litura nucleopolyhedrovirus II]|uniref:IE-1 n=1 Tax=Spodoptera litura nucleopolyhedrovirus II TaxID=566270 RepID=UPI000187465D|nr:IE-1 [Spodoptera litura nucleopolyhedrovirus II]ACI47507.1 IE-1 [Spodoptera litura nucleopolyhedrovirus II]